MRIQRLDGKAFFRDPEGVAQALSDGADVVRIGAGVGEFTLLRSPDAIRQVLVADSSSFRQGKWKRRSRRLVGESLNVLDGADHRRRRLLLQPSLDRRRIASFAPMMVARAERLHGRWPDGQPLDLRRELNRLSLTIAGEALLSTDLDAEADALGDASMTVIGAVPGLAGVFPGTPGRRALRRLRSAAAGILEVRRASTREPDDVVAALLAGGLSRRAAESELVAFLLAAVDEPPTALGAAFHFVGRHPDVEAELHAELDAVLAGRLPTLDDLSELPYVEAILWETLRLAPPVRYIDRCPIGRMTVDGHPIEADANLLVSPLVTHRDERFFARASAFEPERWLGAAGEKRPRFAFLPFGAGPHTCIGEPLAWLTMTLGLATIAARWRLRIGPETRCPAPRRPALVVTPERR